MVLTERAHHHLWLRAFAVYLSGLTTHYWLSYLFCIAYSQEQWHIPCEHWSKNLGKSSLQYKNKSLHTGSWYYFCMSKWMAAFESKGHWQLESYHSTHCYVALPISIRRDVPVMLAFWRARPPELAEKQVATMQPILYSRNSERNWSNIEVCLKKQTTKTGIVFSVP